MLLRLFIIAFTFVLTIDVHAQGDSLKSILNKFDKYLDHSFQEKLFLHTDRTFYLTGDYLWFKIYAVDGTKHSPTDLSKIAYVEIIDGESKPVLQAKVTLHNSTGNSGIFIPASLNSGKYHLRAYTRWMQNFSPEFYFHKTITIVNPFKPLQQNIQESGTKYDIQFFPEGGDMIKGIDSKVAFRVVDKNGKGMQYKGWVIDQDYDTLTTFAPLKFGIGNFKITPQPGKQYRVVVKDLSGNIIGIKEIPQARDDGYGMRLYEEGEKILIDVRSKFNDDALRVVYLIVHARGKLVTSAMKGLHLNTGTFTLDRSGLPEGISHITIFDQDNRPVCERLYFKKIKEGLNLKGNSNKNEYASRQKVDINITAKDNHDKSIASDLSVSVYRLDSLQSEDPVNIQNYLLLTSELKGAIESPSYYFSDDKDVDEAADNLMLTHGWRRFQWKDVLSKKPQQFSYAPEFRGHIVTGNVAHVETREPGINIPAYLSIPGKNFLLRTTKSNRQGEIRFELKDFHGPNKMIVQTNWEVDSMYRIKISNPFSEKFMDVKLPALDVPERFADQLLSRSMGMQFENAYNEQVRGKIISTLRDTIPFYGKPDEHYRLDDFTRFPVMEEVMREYVPGILVRKRKKEFYFITLNDNNNSVFRENPMVLIDGIPVFRINSIMEYDPLKVKTLDVVTKKYFYGSLSFSGLASYRTYDGDYPDFPVDERALILDYEGMLWDREFFFPVYETKEQQSSRIPDFRNVLYWSPSVTTNEQGNGKVEFYTSDQAGLYVVNVQGLTKEGLCGSTSFTFQVIAPPNN